jgi:hypothetical protein
MLSSLNVLSYFVHPMAWDDIFFFGYIFRPSALYKFCS